MIIFSWEYPLRRVGELSDYVHKLTADLVKNNVETNIVTYHDIITGFQNMENGVRVWRVSNPVKSHLDVLTWTLTLNQEVERVAATIYRTNEKKIDLIDVQDWHFIPAAVSMKKAYDLPFIYSIDSLEFHRSNSSMLTFNRAIISIEKLGMIESDKILVKSNWMKNEVNQRYSIQKNKIKVVLPHSSFWIRDIIDEYCTTMVGKKDNE